MDTLDERTYQIIKEYDKGFVLVDNRGGTKIELVYNNGQYSLNFQDKFHTSYNILSYCDIINSIVEHIWFNRNTGRVNKNIRMWRAKKTTKIISKIIAPLYRKILAHNISEIEYKINKRLFHVLGPNIYNRLDNTPLTTNNKYFINDCLKYNGAIYFWFLYFRGFNRLKKEIPIGILDLWMKKLPYCNKAKRLTIQNIPAGITCDTCEYLFLAKIDKPLTTKFEIVLGCNEGLRPILFNSNENQIKTAKKIIEKQLEIKNPRKLSSHNQIGRYLFDYLNTLDKHEHLNILTLAKRSIRYHLDIQQGRRIYLDPTIDLSMPNASFPLNIDWGPNIKFLACPQELIEESKVMGHCVSSYIPWAQTGDSYIFHANYEGEEATIEVDRNLNVRQATGPKNKANKASEWAKKYLNSKIQKALKQQ